MAMPSRMVRMTYSDLTNIESSRLFRAASCSGVRSSPRFPSSEHDMTDMHSKVATAETAASLHNEVQA